MKMTWLNFLHFYQPHHQQKDILDAVVAQCYAPLFKKFGKLDKNTSITININGALLDLFHKHGYDILIQLLKKALENRSVEITGSAKYHAFLPLISESEIERQIKINQDTLKKYFGDLWQPEGFFSPEMGFDPKIIPIIQKMGYKWILLDEIAYAKGKEFPKYDKLYEIEGSDIKVFFRNRRVSNLIMSGVARDLETVKQGISQEMKNNEYLVTAMDGETFGHHHPGLENFLFQILDSKEFKITSISEYLYNKQNKLETDRVRSYLSTWASSMSDIDENIQFLSWKDPDNEIHDYQWKLFNLVLSELNNYPKNEENILESRRKMDSAMSSDHFWWASAKPWWSLEMIENGAYRLVEVMESIPNVSEEKLREAHSLYEKIISTSFEWQRTGKIREMNRQQNEILRIPFRKRTLEGGEPGVYNAFLDLMKNLELDSAKSRDYEKAALWRDAQYKLENKLDIYDTIHVVDLLRQNMPNAEIEKIIEEYKKEYRKIRGGQPEQRGR